MSTLTKFKGTPKGPGIITSQLQQPNDITDTDTIEEPQDIEEALNFIKKALKATSQGSKIDADAKINELTHNLNQTQIEKMLKNIINILKIKKNIDNQINQGNKIKDNYLDLKVLDTANNKKSRNASTRHNK